MNRLSQKIDSPYTASFYICHYYNTEEPIFYNNRTYKYYVTRIEVNYRSLYDILKAFSRCDPTDYVSYKTFIKEWKIVYKKVSENIRLFKTWNKEYARDQLSFRRCSPPLSNLKRFANALLRVRQQMKMFNKLYMMNREKTNER